MIPTFSESNFEAICDTLSKKDKHLKSVIDAYGYPPMWTRDNSFKTLVHIILEQQVSLASALSALNKFEAKLGEITPENALLLTNEEYKQCQFSRQKQLIPAFSRKHSSKRGSFWKTWKNYKMMKSERSLSP